MTAWLVIAGLVAALTGLAWATGRQGARKDEAKKSADIKDKQLEVAADRPDKRELVDRLRNGGGL